MQLRRRKRTIAASLAAASCTLLGGASARAADAPGDREIDRWSFDTAVLYYDEGERVTDASAHVLARRIGKLGRQLAVNLGFDTLTGASASGAVPAATPQTFTTPSGDSTYVAPAGETPLDDSFLDTRLALAVDWMRPLGTMSTLDLGVSLSSEYDYVHGGVSARWSRDFRERNTTFEAGLAWASDTVDPVGGAPVPLAAMLPPGDASNKRGSESKTVADLLVGVTQVFGPRTLGRLDYSFSRSSGYLTDPYKVLSVVDPVTGAPVPGPGALDVVLFESRPDARTKHSLFAQVKRQVGRDVLDGSYRFMTDDWGVVSHTLDLRWRHPFRRFYLQPHVRLYRQGAADFYRRVLFDGDPLPQHASADYRLGELDGTTLGLKLGVPLSRGREWNVRIESYEQSGRAPPEAEVGALAGFDLFPTVDALIVQAGYRF